MEYIGSLEAVWREGESFRVQALCAYRRYTWHASQSVVAAMLNRAYIGDRCVFVLNGADIKSVRLHEVTPMIAKPDLYALGMLAELSCAV